MLLSKLHAAFATPCLLLCTSAQAWLQHWFKHAGLKDFRRQVAVVQPPSYYVLQRANTTFHMTWSYDPDIVFNIQQPPAV